MAGQSLVGTQSDISLPADGSITVGVDGVMRYVGTDTTPNLITSAGATLVAGLGAGAMNVLSQNATTAFLPEASTVIGKTVRVKLDKLSTNAKVIASSGDDVDGLGFVQLQGPDGEASFYAETAARWVMRPTRAPLSGKVHKSFIGHSIVAGQSLAPGQTWAVQSSQRARGGDIYNHNKGVSGDTVQGCIDRYPTDITPNLSSTRVNVITIGPCCTNDLNAAGTAAALYPKVKTLCGKGRTDGQYIIFITDPKSTALVGSEETERLALVAAITDPTTGLVALGLADEVINLDTVAEFQDASKTNILSDGTHPTALACQIIGALDAAATNRILAYAEAAIPTIATLHDLPGCATHIGVDKVTLSGADIATFTDQGPLGHDWTGGGGGGNMQKPAYQPDYGDGLPSAQFDSANNEGAWTTVDLIPAAGPFHVIMYARPTSTTSGKMWAKMNGSAATGAFMSADASAPTGVIFGYIPNTGLSWTVGEPDDPSVRASPTATSTDWHIFELIHDGTRLRMVIDDKECSNNVINFAAVTTTAECIGGIYLHGGSENIFTPRSMDFREHAEFTRVLTWSERQAARALIRAKWESGKRLIATRLLTSASGNFTTGPNTRSIRLRGVGGGGAGGGCTSVGAAAAGAGGGAAGAEAGRTFLVTPNTAYAYTCGAAGAGASGAGGGNGGDSTFIANNVTVTAKGGLGGPVGTATTTLTANPGGAGQLSTNGDVNGSGAPGEIGLVLIVATPIGIGGAGGSSALGGGGNSISAVGNGTNATGFGGGGGGSFTGASAARTGGNGSAGCWIVEEYA